MNKTMYGGALILAGIMVGLLFSGCGTSPAAKFYTLTPVALQKQEMSGSGTVKIHPIALGPVEIPEYLDRPEIVTRAEKNQLVLSEINLWGGTLKADINRVLIENISNFLASDGIPVVTWKIGIADTQRVSVQIVRFDGMPNDNIILKTRWTIIGKDGKTFELVRESNISVQIKGGSYSAMVAAMSDALGELSKEIAAGITSVVKNN